MAECAAAKREERSVATDALVLPVDANRGRQNHSLKTFWGLVPVLFALQYSTHVTLASVWDYGCENAIDNLRNEQQEVESAYNDLETAKSEVEFARSMYNLCSPNRYDDCDFERMNINNAIQEYNDAVGTLRTRLNDFDYAVGRFKTECLL